MANQIIEIPIIIGGKEFKTGNTNTCVMPHDHQHILANYHLAERKEVNKAIENSLRNLENLVKILFGEKNKNFS